MQRCFLKRMNAQKLQSSVQGSGQVQLLVKDGDHQVNSDGNPDLGLHRVGATENSRGVSFEAIAGQTYQIAVSDLGGLTGAIDLKLQAPLVELSLLRAARIVFDTTQLSYAVSVGQIILFQRSNDGANWQNVQERIALRNTIQFSVRTPPAGNGPYYRAVVEDLQAANRSEANFLK